MDEGDWGVKTLAVIMPRYCNNPTTDQIINKCISAVLTHSDHRFQTTLTVVDDGSSVPFTPRENVKLIEHGRNRGIAVGWNTGWKANPDADFLCWLNADCEVTPGWSFPLVAAAEQLGLIAMPYTNGEKSDGLGITGWCFLTSKDTAEKIGPFDETFVPARYEDTDWFHRAIYYHQIPLANVPTSNVLHTRMEGGTKEINRMDLLHMANRFRYSWKHNVDPNGMPPFWKSPLPEVEIE